MDVAFLGLGVMGYQMAGHLQRAGHAVTVYNRTSARATDWVDEYGGADGGSVAGAVGGADIVLMCVGADRDVREVGGAALDAMRPGAVLVDHTTASARVAREMAERAAGRGLGFVDAPISGGEAGARNGALTVMCGGTQSDYDSALPVIRAYAKPVRRMGPPGSGQLTKMINQVCIAGLVQALAEAVHFAKCSGLDPDEVLAAISQGAAQSWQMDNRWGTMARNEFDFGFATDWMRKDLGLVLDEARSNGAHLPVTALVDQFYSEVQALGGGRWDSSSLAALLEQRRKPRAQRGR